MNRAVAIEAADIGGPNHGIFWPAGQRGERVAERRRGPRPSASSTSSRGSAASSKAPAST